MTNSEIRVQWYLRTQIGAIVSVALDVVLLLQHGRQENILVLCRIGFESRIRFEAAIRVKEFAVQKLLSETAGNCHELERLITQFPSDPDLARQLDQQRKILERMRADWSEVKERGWTLKEAADAAGLTDDYKDHYALLSRGAHNSPSGVSSKCDPRILVMAVLQLIMDIIEAADSIVVFKIDDKTLPLTSNWQALLGPLEHSRARHFELCNAVTEVAQRSPIS